MKNVPVIAFFIFVLTISVNSIASDGSLEDDEWVMPSNPTDPTDPTSGFEILEAADDSKVTNYRKNYDSCLQQVINLRRPAGGAYKHDAEGCVYKKCSVGKNDGCLEAGCGHKIHKGCLQQVVNQAVWQIKCPECQIKYSASFLCEQQVDFTEPWKLNGGFNFQVKDLRKEGCENIEYCAVNTGLIGAFVTCIIAEYSFYYSPLFLSLNSQLMIFAFFSNFIIAEMVVIPSVIAGSAIGIVSGGFVGGGLSLILYCANKPGVD